MADNDIFPVDDNDDDVVVTLDMDDGSEVTCEILTIFDLDEQDYIVLLPIEQDGKAWGDDDTVYIYRYFEDEEGNASLDNIDNDDEFERVSECFDEFLDEQAFNELP